MAIECAYSFKDLYVAAFGNEPEEDLLLNLYKLPQEQRNQTVKKWAEKAKWEIKERTGSDGVMYFAFAPKFEN